MSNNPYSAFDPAAPSEVAPPAVNQPPPPPSQLPPAPRIWPVFLVVLASIISFLMGSVIAVVLGQWIATGTVATTQEASLKAMEMIKESRLAFSITVIVPQIALVIPALLAALLSPRGFRQRMKLVRGHWPLWGWFAAAAATPLVGLVASVLVGLFLTQSESLKEMTEMFRKLGQSGFLLPLALMIGGMPAICEELLFRGYVQSRLTRRWGAGLGIVVASAVFAVFHLDPIHVLAVFPIGLWMGWLSFRSGSIIPAMAAHLINNVLSVVSIVLDPSETPDALAAPAALAMVVILGAGLLGIAGVAAAAVFFPAPPAKETVAPSSQDGVVLARLSTGEGAS